MYNLLLSGTAPASVKRNTREKGYAPAEYETDCSSAVLKSLGFGVSMQVDICRLTEIIKRSTPAPRNGLYSLKCTNL